MYTHILSWKIINEGHKILCTAYGCCPHGATHVQMYNLQGPRCSPPPSSENAFLCSLSSIHILQTNKIVGQFFCQVSCPLPCFEVQRYSSHSKPKFKCTLFLSWLCQIGYICFMHLNEVHWYKLPSRDAIAKNSPVGPLAMHSCRLNCIFNSFGKKIAHQERIAT